MPHRLLSTLTATLVVGILAVPACSQQRQAPAHGGIKALPFSVVATGDSTVDMRHASTFSWATGQQQAASEPGPGDVPLDALLQDAIIVTLQGKGYRYSAEPGAGDLIISYRAALDAPGADREPAVTFTDQLQPSLNLTSPDPGKYEKGSLVIEVTDRVTGSTAWRSALQGFANLELSDTERRQRIGLMVDRMLAGVPAK